MILDRLVYRSTAHEVTGPEFQRILIASARNNRRRDITGALTQCDDKFVQVLEGPSDRLDRLLETLTTDRRHSDIKVIGRWPISRRLFCGWAMISAPAAGACSGMGDWLKRSEDGLALVSVMFDMASDPRSLVQSRPLTESASRIFCKSCPGSSACRRRLALPSQAHPDAA